ncbi:MAG: hypothetical protein EP343_25615 [Deltaproteobacteria bacterium]|nr:MAG: hypothetical protein EP343_25615 [Deltaproteobacteria bacterium]
MKRWTLLFLASLTLYIGGYAGCGGPTGTEPVGNEPSRSEGVSQQEPTSTDATPEPAEEIIPGPEPGPEPGAESSNEAVSPEDAGTSPEEAKDSIVPEEPQEPTVEKAPCQPKPEQCNGKDNNCDGMVDCSNHTQDVAMLTQNVGTLAAPGVPGALVVFGRNAFPVAAGKPGTVRDVVAAAAKWGQGRIVIFSHGGYLSNNDLKIGTTGQLLKNVLQWTAFGASGSSQKASLGMVGSFSAETYLKQEGFSVTKLTGDWTQQLASYPTLMINSSSLKTAQQRQSLLRYVENGGGLIMAETGWGWAQLNPKKSIVDDFSSNLLLREVGLAWSGDYISDSGTGYDNSGKLSAYLHAQVALDLLEQHAEGKQSPTAADLAQATHTVSRAIPYLSPADKVFLPRVEALLNKYGSSIVPSAKQPIKLQDGLKRVLLTYTWQKAMTAPADQVKPHPAASTFPGSIPPGAKRVKTTVSIDTKSHDWHSTGLYAAPGEVVTVTIPTQAANQGLSVRIGAHSDRLWGKEEWRRIPEISRVWPLIQTQTKTANAFGGLLYVVVPKNSKLGTIQVTIDNAVPAPQFVLGQTKLTDWKATLRQHPAPWAELASSKIILTVPSSVVRQLDNPDVLMKHYDKVMDASADLATIPRQRVRPERVVMDEQISAGYMHAGYPIMTHLDVKTALTQTTDIATKGGWGIYHEIGHNHQSSHWTFSGTGEVTVNLFTLYVFETVHNNKQPRSNIYGTGRENQIKAYIKNGTQFSEWKSKPFLALIMYMQLHEAFGWSTFQKLFEEYRKAPSSQLPKNDDEKRDQWMIRFSKAVNKNLGPFFQAWGVPTSAAARQSIANLPSWMPQGFPPKP